MGRTLEEQISNKCIHFTGLGNSPCDKGVDYDDVKVKDSSPFKVPCLSHEGMHGGKCEHAEFPTKEQVEKRVNEIQDMSNKTIEAYAKVKEHHQKTGEFKGKVECPECPGNLHYTVAKLNGHIWAKCDECDVGWME